MKTASPTDETARVVVSHPAGQDIEDHLRREVDELERKVKGAHGPMLAELEVALASKRARLEEHVRRATLPDVEPSDPHRRTRAEIEAESRRLR